MRVFCERSPIYNNINNYLIIVNDTAYAMSKFDYGNHKIVNKIGVLSKDKKFIVLGYKLIDINYFTKGMKELTHEEIPQTIKTYFGY